MTHRGTETGDTETGDTETRGTGAGRTGGARARLHTEIIPPDPKCSGAATPRKTRIVLVHGFTQTGRSWGTVAESLASVGHEVILPDAPGHGGSANIRADLTVGARLLGEAGGRATYVGYSMGARLCAHLALAQPQLVERLVFLSATAGIEDPIKRAARQAADEALAATLDPGIPDPARAADPTPADPGSADPARAADPAGQLDAFLECWLARPMWATLSPAAAGREDRRRNTPAGLASSLRLAGTGTQEPLWDQLHKLEMPTLVMAGELDSAFAAHATRIAGLIGPNASLWLVPGAGHAVHLERAEAVTAAIRAFVGDDGGGRGQD
ncbi:MAG: alpha/beta fold hydrolase [Acidimicrobiales bacterium]